MPRAFNKCVKTKGSRVRTKSLSGNKYVKICYLGKKSYKGHIATKKGR